MSKVLKHLNNFEEHILAVLLPVMCITIFISTFTRFTNIFIISWAEELTRYCMVWMTYFGISAAAKRGENFCVTVFAEMLPPSIRKVISVIRMVLMLIFTFIVTKYGFTILENQFGMQQVSPSLNWPMWCVYSVIIIGCVLMTIRYIIYETKTILGRKVEQGEVGEGGEV